ncbi:EamA/RhaT family transporter [Nitrosopumilus ureiphilus]|uniref:EamA/RhaT family transporter n=1 Tax=Nitrosopumilus ureiphilus TaxID=1470067 RepID=A0A7D5RFK6_9ARCH|nr:EamA/RhaT family transporter [Nitrosopumilus ureiphilus]
MQKYDQSQLGYVFAILAAVMFGSVSVIAKPLVSSVDPILLASLVYIISAITLSPFAQKKKKSLTKKDLLLVFSIAICGAVIAPSLYFVGLTHASASDAALIANGEVFFSVLLAVMFFRERLKLVGGIAVLLVLAGMVIITTNLDFTTFTLQQIHYKDMLLIFSMLFWALDNNLSRYLAQKMDVANIVQIKSAIGGIMLFVIALLVFRVDINIEVEQIIPILLLGTVGFAASLYFFLQGLKRIGTVRTITIFSMSSIFGLVAASIFLSEQIGFHQIVAAGIMIFGVYLVSRKESVISPV